jgi:hypothetical protein
VVAIRSVIAASFHIGSYARCVWKPSATFSRAIHDGVPMMTHPLASYSWAVGCVGLSRNEAATLRR